MFFVLSPIPHGAFPWGKECFLLAEECHCKHQCAVEFQAEKICARCAPIPCTHTSDGVRKNGMGCCSPCGLEWRKTLIFHQESTDSSPICRAGYTTPQPPSAEGSLTAFCQVTAHCSITGAFLETRTGEGSVKKGNLLTESFVLHQDQVQPVQQNQTSHSLLIFLEKTSFEHFSAFISFPSSVLFPLTLSLMTKGLNQTAALFGIKLPS